MMMMNMTSSLCRLQASLRATYL